MPLAPVDDRAQDSQNLLALLSARAALARPRILRGMILGGLAGVAAALILGGHRYYLGLPLLAVTCFGVYGLAAQRRQIVTGDADADHSRGVDARIVMKIAGIIGMASAIAGLLCFFLLLMGPSWIS